MTPEEMETLADMIAARLMDTFAARLDMIEEVVFSESKPKANEDLEIKIPYRSDEKTESVILEMLDAGYSFRQIAKTTGCSKTTVLRVKKKQGAAA